MRPPITSISRTLCSCLLFFWASTGWGQSFSYPTQPMTANVGVFRSGFLWILNAQGNGLMQQGVDHVTAFGGLAGDYPIVGNWSGQDCSKLCFNIGIYRSSTKTFMLDTNGDMTMGLGDQAITLSIAQQGDLPVVGDWNGDGRTKVGLYRPLTCEWFLDYDGDGAWNPAVDKHYTSTRFCGTPVVGDWTGSGTTKIGKFANGWWTLDTVGDGVGSGAPGFNYGYSGSDGIPVAGNWYGGHTSQQGVVYQDFLWYLDANSNQQLDPGPGKDLYFSYGSATGSDVPIVGNWTKNPPPANASPATFNITLNYTTNAGSTASFSPGTPVQFALNFYDPVNGSGDIQQGEIFLTDANSGRHCDYSWQRPNVLTALSPSTESFCTASLLSIVNTPANLGQVTVTLNVAFTGADPGTYTVSSNVQDLQGLSSSTGQIGTVTILQISPPYSPPYTPNLADNGTFVTSAYLAVLGRDPDQAGWLLWVNQLNLGATTRDTLINTLLTSAGYQSNPPTDTVFLTNLYLNALNRPPDTPGLNGYLSLLASGQTRSQVVAAFMNLAEFGTVQSNRVYYDEGQMPPDTPPVILGGPNNTTGYRPLLSGTPQYTFVYLSDPRGYSNISSGFVWFVTTDANGNVTQQCPIYFSPGANTVQVETTGQSSSSIVCTVSGGYISGNTVSFYVTFNAAGNFSILADATDTDGLTSPWSTLGTWGVYIPNTNPTPTFTLTGPTTTVNLIAVSPNGGPVVPISVTVVPQNNFASSVSLYSGTTGIVATGSGGPGNVNVNLYATTPGITSLTLEGSSGTQSAFLTIPISTRLTQPTVTVNFIANPAGHGLTVTIDGSSCPTPCALQWVPGFPHIVSVPSPQSPVGVQFTFSGWSDVFGTQQRTVAAGSTPATYYANFTMVNGPTLNGAPPGPPTFPDGRLSSDDPPPPGSHDRVSNTVPPRDALTIPLLESFEFYANHLRPDTGQYSLNKEDFASLEKLVTAVRAGPPGAGARQRQDFGDLLIRSAISKPGLSMIKQFLSGVVADTVHLIGVVDRTGAVKPQYLTEGTPDQCHPPNANGTLNQSAGVDCWWTNELLGFVGNQIGNKSITYCTGDCSNLMGFVNGSVFTRNKGLPGETVLRRYATTNVSAPALQWWNASLNPPAWTGGAWTGSETPDIQPGTYTSESFHGYMTNVTDANNNTTTVQIGPPFTWFVCSGTGWTCIASSGYMAQTALLWGQITLGVPTSTPSQATASDYYVLKNCASPVALYAFISFPNAPASLVSWNGGNVGSDNLHRSVPCTTVGDIPVSFSLNGHQMASATVHVITPVTINLIRSSVMVGHFVQAVVTSPETATVQLSVSGPTPVTFDQPTLNLTAGVPQTVTITPGQQPSRNTNDVQLVASINLSQVGQASMTVMPNQATMVFLLHGIGQDGSAMVGFQTFLTQRLASDGLDSTKVTVDTSFNFGCASMSVCDYHCGISGGAALLAQTITQRASAGTDVILVGYSMGGLVARDMMATASSLYPAVLQRNVTALITLGTPNLGYPWAPIDDTAGDVSAGIPPPFNPLSICPFQMDQMGSDFRSGENDPTFNPHVSPTPGSDYLRGLTSAWTAATQVPSWGPVYWLAISGSYCSNAPRITNLPTQNYGCPDYNPWSDGIVCDQSARYQTATQPCGGQAVCVINPIIAVDSGTGFQPGNPPTESYAADYFAHTSLAIMCGPTTNNAPWLYFPGAFSDVMSKVVAAVEAHQ